MFFKPNPISSGSKWPSERDPMYKAGTTRPEEAGGKGHRVS